MALKSCLECKNKISDQAIACPHCGYPKEGADKIDMSSHLYTFLSLIFALFIADILAKVFKIIINIDKISLYQPHTLYSIYAFLLIIEVWWALPRIKKIGKNFLSFFFTIVGIMLLYGIIFFTFAKINTATHFDFKEYFSQNYKAIIWFNLIFIVYVFFNGIFYIKEKVKGVRFYKWEFLYRLLLIISLATGLIYSTEFFKLLVAWIFLTIFILFICFCRWKPGEK